MYMPDQRDLVNTESTGSPPVSPPHNIEAEQALLGAMLLNNEVWDRLPPIDAVHFYDPLHGQIFTAIIERIKSGKPADPVTLGPAFTKHQAINEFLTVPQYLGRLAASAVSIVNAVDYAREITEHAAQRRIIDVGMRLVEQASDGVPSKEIVEEAERFLLDVSEAGGASTWQTFKTAVSSVIDEANDAYRQGGRPRGMSTGLIDLDKKLGGLVNGNLVVIAGRPGMGKTAFAVNIAWYLAKLYQTSGGKEGCVVQFDSMEMQARELAGRVLATECGIPASRIATGDVDDREIEMVNRTALDIEATPLNIDDAGGLTLGRLASRARRIKRKTGFGLLVIDYLQLIMGSSGNSGNRVQDVTEITVGLKALAKELNVPIIALSQLSRKVEERADKRPQLSDLRESGSIEQDADVVMFVFREEYYVERERPGEDDLSKFSDWQRKLSTVAGRGEVILGKNRAGESGVLVPVAWDGRLTKFSNLTTRGF